MNPQTMLARGKIRYTFFPTEQLGPFWAETLARNIQNEPHLLPHNPATLRDAASGKRLIVVYDKENDLLVGCAAMWPLGESDEGIWFRFGTMFVIEPYRYRCSGMKIADEMYRRMLNMFSHLPCNIRRATCVCPASKTGIANPLYCPLVDTTCFVHVSRETYERLGRPESPPFPF